MELSIERSEESFKQPEIIKPEDFVQQVQEEVVESSDIKIPVEKIEEIDETPIVINLQENHVTENNSLNEIIPVTLKNETGLDCSSLSPTCGQGLDIVNVVSLKMEDFKKLDDHTNVLDISDEPGQSIEIEGEEEDNLYDEDDESETDEQSFSVKNLDSSTIVLDDDDEDDDDDGEEGLEDDEIEEEEEDGEDEDDDSDSEIGEEDSDIEEIQSSPIKTNPNEYDPMEGTSSNIQGDWDRWRIKKKRELEEAAFIEAIPIPITMKPRKRTFLQRIKKRSIKWISRRSRRMHVMDEKDDIEKSESITKNHKNDEIVINYLPPKEKSIEIDEKIKSPEILIAEDEEEPKNVKEEIMEISEVSEISEIIETSEIKESEVNGKCDEKILELIEEEEEKVKPKLEVKVIEIPSDVPLVLSESKVNEIAIEMPINEPEVIETIKNDEPIPLEKPKEIDETKSEPIVSRKRSLSPDPEPKETIQPSKKLKREVELSFSSHDKLLCDYIDKTSNNTVDEMQQHIDNISDDVQALNEMIQIKEQEWNNVIYLKKVKEEILVRLTRKKNIMEIMSTKIGQISDYNFADTSNSAAAQTSSNSQINKKSFKDNLNTSIFNNMTPPMLSSTPNNTISNNNSTASGIIIDAVLNTSSAQSILQNRANMKSADLAKEKIHTSRLQRSILPKPSNTPLNFTTAYMQNKNGTNDYFNGNHQQQMGRQGATKDVQSIIADYRQRHPETVPRRGRRVKSIMNDGTGISSSRSSQRSSTENRIGELGLFLQSLDGSRPSSADSSRSNSNTGTHHSNVTATTNVSFKDVLMKFAKMTPHDREMMSTNSASNLLSELSQASSSVKPPPPYPEVSLLPVGHALEQQQQQQLLIQQQHQQQQQQQQQTPTNSYSNSNSLLHGILTKNANRPASTFTSFSPTLARLLTAPERINPVNNYPTSQPGNLATGMNLTKGHNEITITPVVGAQTFQPSMFLQQQQQQMMQRQQNRRSPAMETRIKTEQLVNMILAADEEDSVDNRLVIDEGEAAIEQQQNPPAPGQEFHENEVPECQGCKSREAQFVCAGCANQWYCSRECQVTAWDDHSDVCTG